MQVKNNVALAVELSIYGYWEQLSNVALPRKMT